jgi:hypothetical protein
MKAPRILVCTRPENPHVYSVPDKAKPPTHCIACVHGVRCGLPLKPLRQKQTA